MEKFPSGTARYLMLVIILMITSWADINDNGLKASNTNVTNSVSPVTNSKIPLLVNDPTLELRFVTNQGCSDTYCATIQIRVKEVGDSTQLGTSSILFNYNPNALAYSSYTSLNFDGSDNCFFGGLGPAWEEHGSDGLASGTFNITLTILGLGLDYSCPIIKNDWIDVGTICFDILSQDFGNLTFSTDPQQISFNANEEDENGEFPSIPVDFVNMGNVNEIPIGNVPFPEITNDTGIDNFCFEQGEGPNQINLRIPTGLPNGFYVEWAIDGEVMPHARYEVSVNENSVQPQYLNVYVGDTVVWTNVSGNNSIDGSASAFPSNPDYFTSGSASTSWTLTHVFTELGQHNYNASLGSGSTLSGGISVSDRYNSVLGVFEPGNYSAALVSSNVEGCQSEFSNMISVGIENCLDSQPVCPTVNSSLIEEDVCVGNYNVQGLLDNWILNISIATDPDNTAGDLVLSGVASSNSSFPTTTPTGQVSANSCTSQSQVWYAAYECDIDGNGTIDSYVNAGSFTLNIYPSPQAPSLVKSFNENAQTCSYSIIPVCPNDVFNINPSTLNEDCGASNLGSISISISNDNCTESFNVSKPSCDACTGCENQEIPITENDDVCGGTTINLNSYITDTGVDVIWTGATGQFIDPPTINVSNNTCNVSSLSYIGVYYLQNGDCLDEVTVSLGLNVEPEISGSITENDCSVSLNNVCPDFGITWSDNLGNSGTGNTYTANDDTNGSVTFTVTNNCESETFTGNFNCIVSCDTYTEEDLGTFDFCSGSTVNLNLYTEQDLDWTDSNNTGVNTPSGVELSNGFCNTVTRSYTGTFTEVEGTCTSYYTYTISFNVFPEISGEIEVLDCQTISIVNACSGFDISWVDDSGNSGNASTFSIPQESSGEVTFSISNQNAPAACNAVEYSSTYSCFSCDDVDLGTETIQACSGESIDFTSYVNPPADASNPVYTSSGGVVINTPGNFTPVPHTVNCNISNRTFFANYTRSVGTCEITYTQKIVIQLFPVITGTLLVDECNTISVSDVCDNFSIEWADDLGNNGSNATYNIPANNPGIVNFVVSNPASPDCESITFSQNFECYSCDNVDLGTINTQKCSGESIDMNSFLTDATNATDIVWTNFVGTIINNPAAFLPAANNTCSISNRVFFANYRVPSENCEVEYSLELVIEVFPAINASLDVDACNTITLLSDCSGLSIEWTDDLGNNGATSVYNIPSTNGSVTFTVNNLTAPFCEGLTFTESYDCFACEDVVFETETIQLCSGEGLNFNDYSAGGASDPIMSWTNLNGFPIGTPGFFVPVANATCNVATRGFIGSYSVDFGNCSVTYTKRLNIELYPEISGTLTVDECNSITVNTCPGFSVEWVDDSGTSGMSSVFSIPSGGIGSVNFSISNPDNPSCNGMTLSENYDCFVCEDVFLGSQSIPICSGPLVNLNDYIEYPSDANGAYWTDYNGMVIEDPENFEIAENPTCSVSNRIYNCIYSLEDASCNIQYTKQVIFEIYPTITPIVNIDECTSIILSNVCPEFDISWQDDLGNSGSSANYYVTENTQGSVSFSIVNPLAPECPIVTVGEIFSCIVCPDDVAFDLIEISICTGTTVNLNENLANGVDASWHKPNGAAVNNPEAVSLTGNNCYGVNRTYIATYSEEEENGCIVEYEQSVKYLVFPEISAEVIPQEGNCNLVLETNCPTYDISWTSTDGQSGEGEFFESGAEFDGDINFEIVNPIGPACQTLNFTYSHVCTVACTEELQLVFEAVNICSGQDLILNNAIDDSAVDVSWRDGDNNSINGALPITFATYDCDGESHTYNGSFSIPNGPYCFSEFSISFTANIAPAINYTVNASECGVSLENICDDFDVSWQVAGGASGNGADFTADEGASGEITFTINSPLEDCGSETVEASFDCPDCPDEPMEYAETVYTCYGNSINLNEYFSTNGLTWLDEENNPVTNPSNLSIGESACEILDYAFTAEDQMEQEDGCVILYNYTVTVKVVPEIQAEISEESCNIEMNSNCPDLNVSWETSNGESGAGSTFQAEAGESGTVFFTIATGSQIGECNELSYSSNYNCACETVYENNEASDFICSGETLNLNDYVASNVAGEISWQNLAAGPVGSPEELTLYNNECDAAAYAFEGVYSTFEGNCETVYSTIVSISVYPQIDASADNGLCAVQVEVNCDNFEIEWSDSEGESGSGDVYSAAVGSSGQVVFTITNPDAEGNCSITTEIASYDCPDPDYDKIDLELTKALSSLEDSYEIGDIVHYVISLVNKGNVSASGVIVSEQLPAGLTYEGHVVSNGAYNSVSGIWTVGSTPSNVTNTLVVYASIEATGEITNTAELIAANQEDVDSYPGNGLEEEDDQDSYTIFVEGSGDCVPANCGSFDFGCVEIGQPTLICPEFCNLSNDYILESVEMDQEGVFVAEENCFYYQPFANNQNQNSEKITVSASDLDGNCAALEIWVAWNCPEPPSAVNDNYYSYGAVIEFNATGNDEGEGVFICDILNEPDNGDYVLSGNTIVYTPYEGFEGLDHIEYQICNDNGNSNTALITIQVSQEPECELEPIVTCTGIFQAVTICVDFCSPDMQLETIQAQFICTITMQNQNCFTYRPFPVYDGVDEITVTGCNYFGECEERMVNINVSEDCDGSSSRYTDPTLANTNSLEQCKIEIPNVLTPNQDGVNDALVSKGLGFCYQQFEMDFLIMNRMGQILYEQKEIDDEGNLWYPADDVLEGVYYYILKLSDGENDINHSGFIELRR